MYQYKTTISSNDTDINYDLKASSLYMILQDAAMGAVVDLGIDSLELQKLGIDWIITRMDVEILKFPKYRDEITIQTYPAETQMCFYPRYWRILDKDGNVIIRASSIWALLDHQTRRVSMRKDIVPEIAFEKHDDQIPQPRKIIAADTQLVDERKIYYSEIDLNGHLNNCSYIKLLVDIHDVEFYKKHQISGITTNYVKEVYAGQTVKLYTKLENNVEVVEAKVDDEVVLTAEIRYKEK